MNSTSNPLDLIRKVLDDHERRESERARVQEAALVAFCELPSQRQAEFLTRAFEHFAQSREVACCLGRDRAESGVTVDEEHTGEAHLEAGEDGRAHDRVSVVATSRLQPDLPKRQIATAPPVRDYSPPAPVPSMLASCSVDPLSKLQQRSAIASHVGHSTQAPKPSESSTLNSQAFQDATVGGEPFIDLAEDYVHKHPDGCTTEEVGRAIGQEKRNVNTSLRQIELRRRSIVRRDGRWFPLSDAPSPRPVRQVPLHVLITNVLSNATNLRAKEVAARVLEVAPTVASPSVFATLNKMFKANKVTRSESGGRRGRYSLSSNQALTLSSVGMSSSVMLEQHQA